MSDDALDPEQITATGPDANFAASEERTFRGEPLKPFSVRRQFAAQAMGNKLLSGRVRLEFVECDCGGIPECKLCDGTGEHATAYDGMFIDVAQVLYLCRCLQSEVLLASRRPETVLASVLGWAEEVGMCLGSESFEQACEVFVDIMRELKESQFKITKTPPGGSGSKNE